MSISGSGAGLQWAALRNRELVAFIVGHLLAGVAEWAVFIGVLVYAHEYGGARATGLASIALLSPYVFVGPLAGRIVARFDAGRARLAGLAAQVGGYGLSALAAGLGTTPVLVVAACMVGLAGTTVLRPAGAVLLPSLVRSTRELTIAYLWVGYAETAGVLVGPLFAAAMLAVDGPDAVLGGSTVLVLIGLATATKVRGLARLDSTVSDAAGSGGFMLSMRALSRRKGAIGVLAVAGGQSVLVGALDILIVVIASDHVDLGNGGPGILSALFGVGAVASGVATTALVGRARLAVPVGAALGFMAAATITFGFAVTLVVAVTLLPLLGLARSTLDVLSRILLQRSAPPSDLAAVFAALEVSGGLGLLGGSLAAQALLAVSGVTAALVGVGALYAVMLGVSWRSLRVADEGADVPVMAMSFLGRLPAFAPLTPFGMEAVARAAEEVPVRTGEVVINEGEPGDRFYGVVDGRFEVSISGELVRTLGRGDSFGEVALVADVPRTATVTASSPGMLLAIDREPFLLAVTGHEGSRQAVWGAMRGLRYEQPLPEDLEAVEHRSAGG